MRLSLILLLLGTIAPRSNAQVSKVEPAEPRWSQTITVTYDPGGKDAKFNLRDQVFVVMFLYYADHPGHAWGRMEKAGGVFRYQFVVEEPLDYITFHFVTPSSWDLGAALGIMINRADGVPVCGAYSQSMTQPFLDPQYKQRFEKEMALCPDNFSAYADKWFVASAFDRASQAAMVAEDMKKISARAKGEPADYLHALSAGYLMLNQETQSRAVLRKMVERFPTSPLTADALRNYAYHFYADRIAGPGRDEVKRMELELIELHPDLDVARDLFSSLFPEDQEKYPSRLSRPSPTSGCKMSLIIPCPTLRSPRLTTPASKKLIAHRCCWTKPLISCCKEG